ncbi:MAG: (Fe-S)-binding protein [Pseudomonadota bacterium]
MIDKNIPMLEKKMITIEPFEIGIGSLHELKDLARKLLPDTGSIDSCLNCGACSSGCPASGLAGMDPRKFVRKISLGMDWEIMTSNWVWMCTTCDRCIHVCPMKIDIPKLVSMVRGRWPKNEKPQGIVNDCDRALKNDTCSTRGMDSEEFKFIIEDVADDVRQTQKGFETLNVPIDKKGAKFFLNQSSEMPIKDPLEMPPLWKILHLVDADWTFGSQGWAAENFGMFLSDHNAWENIARKKASILERLGCKVLLNTECGHDFLAAKKGMEMFNITHSFKIKSIIEYYAKWVRQGRLKVNSDWNLDLKVKFTVQDPCQLVRKGYGDFLADEVRFIIKEAVGEENFVDMHPNRSNNYCCGGGGGAILSDFKEERMAYGKIKVEQILDTGATYCITPCNNCHGQLQDLSHHYNARFKSVHLWTILCLAMGVLGENERKFLGDDLARVGLPSYG